MIKRLDDRTALALRGSHTISTVARAVEELVLNSIHSGATSISATLLPGGGGDFEVTDNGPGIDGEALRDHVGTDYCSAVGRGESLLSLSNLCTDMVIETRRERGSAAGKGLVRFRKVFREGVAVSFQSSLDGNLQGSIIAPSHLTAPQHTGTTITIRGVSTTLHCSPSELPRVSSNLNPPCQLFQKHAVRRRRFELQEGDQSTNLANLTLAMRVLALSNPLVDFILIGATGDVERLDRSAASGDSKPRALIQRLSAIYPNDFDPRICVELSSDDIDSSTKPRAKKPAFRAFGAICFAQQDAGSCSRDAMSHGLRLVAINNRPADQASLLSEAVNGCIKPRRGSGASAVYFIHVTAANGEVVIKDGRSSVMVPQVDQLADFLKRLVLSSHCDGGSDHIGIVRPNDEAENCFRNNPKRRIIRGDSISNQHLVRKLDSVSPSRPPSPFSSAFFSSAAKPKREIQLDEAANGEDFDDIFFSTGLGDTSNDFADLLVRRDFADDEAQQSKQWTKQRIKALDRTIADAALTASDKKITLTKEMLNSAEVIAQVEHKFIIVNMRGVLCAVDQHAADERVSLEKLEDALFNPDLHESDVIRLTKRSIQVADLIKGIQIFPAKRLYLSMPQMTTARHHASLLHRWKFTFQEVDSRTVLLTGLPSICGRTPSVSEFTSFVNELGHVAGAADCVKPSFVKNILASNACRYATMFGDELQHSRCVDLIASLGACRLPFVCAHGRPSVVPLIEVSKERPSRHEGTEAVESSVARSSQFGPRRVLGQSSRIPAVKSTTVKSLKGP